ncbi:MAG: hypothetical protein JNK00_01760 [Flavipsychrobacter sp.]|nr:hypothetical protein [Flavipsychrobacter sp.]
MVDALDVIDYKAIKVECERKINLLEAKLGSVNSEQEEDIEKHLDKALYNLAHLDKRYETADIKTKRQFIDWIFTKKL